MKGKKIPILLIFLLFFSTAIAFSQNVPVSASSAIVMNVATGRVLYEKNISEKRPMASTTKIMTALLALEETDLEDMIKVSNQAVGVEGSSIYLQYNEKVKMKDLIYGLMLRSGNDAATAIACHVSGSLDKFAALMNKRAKEIGAKNTHFENPHGLHHKNHYTTAYDLALITREALKNKDFNKIVKTKLWVSERDGYKYFYNKNKTLSQFKGGDGVKTGYTKVAGRCLVTSATRDGMQLVCVVLNDPNWFKDSYHLLDDVFEKYKAVPIIKKDVVLKRVTVNGGKKLSTGIVSKEDIIIPVTKEEKGKIVKVLDINKTIKAPILRGMKVGSAKIYLNNELLCKTDLIAREDIEEKDFRDKVLDFIKDKN